MKMKVIWASDSNRHEEWEIDTFSDLLEKVREHGSLILNDQKNPNRQYDIMVYDDYIDL